MNIPDKSMLFMDNILVALIDLNLSFRILLMDQELSEILKMIHPVKLSRKVQSHLLDL